MPGNREPSDGDLVAAANRGDRDALGLLYERHRDFVHAVAWRLLGDADLAAEAVQEVFLWWLSRFPGFQLSGRATTFLYAVTRSRAIDLARRRGRAIRGGADLDALAALPAARASEIDPRLARLLGSLPVGQQEVLLLRVVHELALAEIATALGIPLGTVKSRLHLALAALRAELRAEPDADGRNAGENRPLR